MYIKYYHKLIYIFKFEEYIFQRIENCNIVNYNHNLTKSYSTIKKLFHFSWVRAKMKLSERKWGSWWPSLLFNPHSVLYPLISSYLKIKSEFGWTRFTLCPWHVFKIIRNAQDVLCPQLTSSNFLWKLTLLTKFKVSILGINVERKQLSQILFTFCFLPQWN